MRLVILSTICLFLIGLQGCVTTTTGVPRVKSQKEKVDPEKGTGNIEAAEKRLQLGLSYLEKGMLPQAKRNLDKVLYHVPQMAGAFIGLGYYYQVVQEFDKAELYYKKGLNLEPNNPGFLNTYGAFLCKIKKFDEALDSFTLAISIPTYDRVAYTYENMGLCSVDKGDIVNAKVYLKKALTYNENLPNSLFEMAVIAFEERKFLRARGFLQKYIEIGGINAKYLWLSLRTESKLGNENAVASYGLKLERMFPTSDEAQYYMETKSQW
jgi:type IV pilus assembly protein PilF